jgi:hypothetical protein
VLTRDELTMRRRNMAIRGQCVSISVAVDNRGHFGSACLAAESLLVHTL